MPLDRIDNRAHDALRPLKITRSFIENASGSVLIEWGKTRVICTVTVDNRAPSFLAGTGKGWLTAEYGMLPGSTNTRKPRSDHGRTDGRSVEIQRLIGRSLRAVVDMSKLGERTLWVDCDVIQADGGTRTCSITGAFVALVEAVGKLMEQGLLSESPIVSQVAAVSVGIVEETACVDLCYVEDSAAAVDMNLVMTSEGCFVEVQGTGEERAFSRQELDALLGLGERAIRQLMEKQREALGDLQILVGG